MSKKIHCGHCERKFVKDEKILINDLKSSGVFISGVEIDEVYENNTTRYYDNLCNACFHHWIDGNSIENLQEQFIDEFLRGVSNFHLKRLATEIIWEKK